MANKNPKWARDELILALDLYFEIDFTHNQSEKNSRIRELSKFLNSLPIHDEYFRNKDFRNSSGVYMKLSNFLRLDPSYSGSGLQRGSKSDEAVWNEFSNDLNKLSTTAQLIRQGSILLSETQQQPEINDDIEFAEGKILTKIHKIKERNSSLAKKKKEQVLKKTGKLICEVCDFDFYSIYGEIGKGFAECHHIIPLSELNLETKTKLSDLAILCANCHRIIHRTGKWLSIEDLRDIVSAKKKN